MRQWSMAWVSCPSCGRSWESSRVSGHTRCRGCRRPVYVPGPTRDPREVRHPYPVRCGCGHSWTSRCVTGKTRCPQCRMRVYIPASARGTLRRRMPPATLAPTPRREPRPSRVPETRRPGPVASLPPREAAAPPAVCRLSPIDALMAQIAEAVGRPTRAGSTVPPPAPAPGTAPAVAWAATEPRAVTERCPMCSTGISMCRLPGCPMPPDSRCSQQAGLQVGRSSGNGVGR